jgi:hypothetical protein
MALLSREPLSYELATDSVCLIETTREERVVKNL